MRVRSPVLIGRREELAELVQALDEAAAGRPGLAVISGEAGVGKSRLVEELGRLAEERGARVLIGAAADFGEGGLPFGALVEALRPVLRADTDKAAMLSGESSRDRSSQARIFERLLAFLTDLSAQQTLLLVLEDLHWADASTREFVAFLSRNLGSARILMVATYRIDDVGRDHPLRAYLVELQRGRVRALELDRFDRDELRAQLSAIRGAEVSAILADALYERSQGNAFFSEELLASTTGDEPPAELPSSLRETLLARIDRLSPSARAVVDAAAIAGIADDQLLAGVTGLPDDDLNAALREALARNVLLPLRDGGYQFRHALLREAIYHDLLGGERMRMHRAVAEILTARFRGGHAEAWVLAGIAHHWDAAGRDREAFIASWRAALGADRAYAHTEASRLYLRAAEIWPRIPDAAELLAHELATDASPDPADRATVLQRAGRATEAFSERSAVPVFERALAELDAAMQTDRFALLAEKIATLTREVSDPAGAARADAALASVIDRISPQARGQLLIEQSEAAMIRGSFEQAYEHAAQALPIAEASGRFDNLIRSLISAGRASGYLGRLDEARRDFARSRELARRLDDRWAAAAVDKWEGDLLQAASQFEAAIALLRRAIAAHVEVGQTSDAEHAQAIVGQSLHRLGRWRDADAVLSLPGVRSVRWSHVLRAYLRVQQGRLEEAQRELESVVEFVEMSGSTGSVGPYYSARIERLLWQGDPEAALGETFEALERVTFASDMRWIGEVLRLGLWAAADIGTRGRDRAERLHAELVTKAVERRAAGTIFEPEIRGSIASADAEISRLSGSPDPELWAAAAEAWAAIPEPYPQAYALYRQGEALVVTDRRLAAPPLRRALAIARELGAGPLARAIDQLARRAGIRAADERQTRGTDAYGLTAREREVLALIARGRTDQEIAAELFISPKTASVHVSNVKGKLGVERRIEAARIGLELRLDDDAASAVDET